jgi:phosphoribosylpyrophosphate synthetase
MVKIYEDITKTIGNTPLVRLHHITKGLKASVLEKLIVTDTIPHSDEEKRDGRIEVVSCASLLAEAIKRIHTGDSVSSLFG